MTRRRAALLGAAAGPAAALLPAAVRAAASPAIARVSVTPGDIASGRTFAAGGRFVLAGAEGAIPRGLEIRARDAGGAWGPWLALVPQGHGPDGGRVAHRSEPAWTGPASEFQLRAAGSVRGRLTVLLVPEDERAPRRVLATAAQTVIAAPEIVPRAAWGGDGVKPRTSPAYGSVQIAFVHHTVNANTYTEADAPGIVLAIARYHRDGNRWNDIGYNFLVDRFGRIYEGRAGGIDLAVTGAQAGGWNSVSTGVSIIGTFDSEQAPAAATEAVARLLAWKLPLHGAPVIGELAMTSSGGSANRWRAGTKVTFERISGHRDGCSTTCPGNALYGQLEEIRARALVLAGSAGITPPERPAVALTPPPAAVRYGLPLTIAGNVRDGSGAAITGRPVAIQKRGSNGWVTIARATTDEQGLFGAVMDWKRGGDVRVAVRATDGALVRSTVSTVRCTREVTAVAKTKRVRFGRRAVVTGTLTPATKARLVVERQGRDGRYRRIASVAVKPGAGGAYRAVARLSRPALHRMRVVADAGAGVDAGASAQMFVRAIR